MRNNSCQPMRTILRDRMSKSKSSLEVKVGEKQRLRDAPSWGGYQTVVLFDFKCRCSEVLILHPFGSLRVIALKLDVVDHMHVSIRNAGIVAFVDCVYLIGGVGSCACDSRC
ncbi:hypothetical protein V6N11_013896 [Hibiscus sabdariffa]|uniref:Uncharacterized protein n=2 Tax=Hibiscus sabdariffa TaxID=183260 RepID=A0ABR1ZMW5_9ROSI